MRLLVALAAAAALLVAPAAEAAGPKVTWPEQRTYAPGEKLTVKVVSPARVRVALVRESASGKVMRTVARRTLRRGTFSAAAPRAGRYSLRVGARSRDFTVAAKPASSPRPSEPLPCARSHGDAAELRLAAPTVIAGGVLSAEVVNTSAGCLMGGVGYLFERLQPDGSWARVPTNLVFITVGVMIEPGRSFPKQVQIPADFAPGSYRLRDSVYGANGAIELTAPFEVIAS
jgi:hypothetical protein